MNFCNTKNKTTFETVSNSRFSTLQEYKNKSFLTKISNLSSAFRYVKRGCCVHYGNVVVQQPLSASYLQHALASQQCILKIKFFDFKVS